MDSPVVEALRAAYKRGWQDRGKQRYFGVGVEQCWERALEDLLEHFKRKLAQEKVKGQDN